MMTDKKIRVLYIYTSASLNSDSVQSKIINQIEALNNAGVDCKGAFFSFDIEAQQALSNNITLFPVTKIYYRRFASRIRKLQIKAALDYIKPNHRQYDFVYFRYPSADYTLWKISRLVKNKIFFEHLCIEIDEIKLHRKEIKFSIKPSVILSYLEYLWLPLIKEYLWGSAIRKNASFGLCNTKQTADWQSNYTTGKYKTYINGDAVNCSAFPIKKYTKFSDQLNMIFLKGASGAALYNGLDRLMAGIYAYNGNINIKLHILGDHKEYEIKLAEKHNIKNNIIFIERLEGKKLDDYIDNMHLGVSALGMHRKGLTETTTIKSREYFARGLPFIYGHYDPEIDKLEHLGYTKRFEADDSSISLDALIDFTNRVYENKNHAIEMNKITIDNFDFGVKAARLKKILEQEIS